MWQIQKFQRIRDLNNNFKAENYKAVRVISREVSQIKKMRFAHFWEMLTR